MLIAKILKYRGANALIRFDGFHKFEYIVCYKDLFYSKEFEFNTGKKQRQYDTNEYLSALAAMIYAVKRQIDIIKNQRSIIRKIVNYFMPEQKQSKYRESDSSQDKKEQKQSNYWEKDNKEGHNQEQAGYNK